MKAFLALSLREKMILILALMMLFAMAVDKFVWQSINQEYSGLVETIEQEKEDLAWITQKAPQISRKKSVIKPITGSLLSWLDLRMKRFKINDKVSRIKPVGNKEVKVWVDKVNIDQLLQLLGDIKNYNVDIYTIKIDALPESAFVNAIFTIKLQ